jgi:hypothetical protein
VTNERVPYDEPQTWYFTFGFAHPHAGTFVRIENAPGDAAREQMFARFGRDWGFQYDDAAWHKHGISQAEKYGLIEIALGEGGVVSVPPDPARQALRVILGGMEQRQRCIVGSSRLSRADEECRHRTGHQQYQSGANGMLVASRRVQSLDEPPQKGRSPAPPSPPLIEALEEIRTIIRPVLRNHGWYITEAEGRRIDALLFAAARGETRGEPT